MKIAVEGCCHGELDKIYETIAFLEEREKMKVDVLLCCGDFQAVRNYADLQCMAVPPKYQKLNTFYKYYSGEKKAPILTIFVGGNHEASNYLQELPYGGWVAPNIYYLGYAGVIQIGGVRIGGLSGIYKGRDYNKGHFEKVPYTEDTKRSVYHVRNLEVFRLKQISRPMDIFISHDWPQGIYEHGNKEALLRHKKHFREEVEQRTLGSPAAEELLYKLKPSYWFAAHLHVKFPALVVHQSEGDTAENKQTRFLSLDKCLPKRNFLQVVDIEHNPEKELKIELDPEWLCILKSTNHLLSLRSTSSYMPGLGSNERYEFTVTEEEKKALVDDFGGLLLYPDKFETTAPTLKSGEGRPKGQIAPPKMYINPQTKLLSQMLDITDPNAVFLGQHETNLDSSINPSAISLDDEGLEDAGQLSDDNVPDTSGYLSEQSFEVLDRSSFSVPHRTALETSVNPAEISLDDDDDDDDDDDEAEKEVEDSLAGVTVGEVDSAFSCDSQTTDTEAGVSPVAERSPSKLKFNVEKAVLSSSVQDQETQNITSPKAKKFKRRNHSLYVASDDS